MSGSQPSRATQIAQLCDSWVAAVQLPGGGLGIGGTSEQFRLLRNGVVFHELDYEELRAACLGLGRVLLLPGLNTAIDFDHFFFWSWCAELILFTDSAVFSPPERELAELFGSCTRASLANARLPAGSKEEWQRQREVDKAIPFHLNQLATKAHLVLAYLSFPLIEGTAKKLCNAYVGYDGTVAQAFTVPRLSGKPRSYTPGEKCSSLMHLLTLLHAQVASPTLRAGLDEYRQHLQSLEPGTDPFELLFEWRNSSLHGHTSYPTIGGTVFNIVILILLDQVAATYTTARDGVWQHVQWNMQSMSDPSYRSPWSYYPPF